ncbi:MAG TPA: glycine dehydrogenase (aminomethyl-transferring) [Betaproteobacteria bacterium]|nr:glycine dehydrogenase (aminomethyl-transferring) [Betaproteobacteria bacterium]
MSLTELADGSEFHARHIGPNEADLALMLKVVGAATLDDLIGKIVPKQILKQGLLALNEPRTEQDVLADLKRIAAKNKVFKSFIGQGYYGNYTPGVILRNILENPAWYTAYTPYQPEISQGRLEALLNFQTMVCDLTGMEISNSSLLDEATAAAEAMTLAKRSAKSKSNTIIVAGDCHPQTIALIKTRAEPLGLEVKVGFAPKLMEENDYFGVVVQYPSTSGQIHDMAPYASAAHAKGALFIACADLLALTLLKPPGEWGADIVVGTSQRFGVPFGFGGPHAAYLACKDAFKRSMPGRLVGVSVDAQGNRALRLAMQTREQHIRREKATSNICTAQVLLAVMASMYAVYHGPRGLTKIARRTHTLTATFAAGLAQLGFEVIPAHVFDTITVRVGERHKQILDAALALEINLRDFAGQPVVGVSFDETHGAGDVEQLLSIFASVAGKPAPKFADIKATSMIPETLQRTSAFLTHPVFNMHHSETEMLRYIRSLSDKDLALDRTMIPLGSCTMKLNATTEMIPVTWPGFNSVHPFAPLDQTLGYQELTSTLEAQLCEITGYDAVSLQPNSGAQGEYAGLLAIRAYHRSRGEAHRDVCLIPSSAHGTNPASAQMVGMEVVVTACDEHGNVDVADLTAKADQYKDRLAALMVTYPSTHGVFEDAIKEICAIIHDRGGQVYMDGANLNALVGVAQPGKFGSDVSHLNLHKTFCIPHGGGGPGVGPIGVGKHLAPFLPGHPMATDNTVGPVSAAPFGSASILPISWAYIAMMGASGLRRATEVAILNANYVAKRLAPHYPVLYSGNEGLVAHECILDIRPLKEITGISNEDIAKRLIDFGFHAPTMSFPVAGTLMIEPTESESKQELDRFCDAMIQIRHEIRAVEEGRIDREDNPLRNAPHTAQMLMAENWVHDYTREAAAYPVPRLKANKYWVPVARVDNVYGDRNLVCSCPPLEDYIAEAAPVL